MNDKSLIDKYLPEFTFSEIHEIVVNAPIDIVYHKTKNIDLSRSKIIVLLFKIRGLPVKRLNLQNLISDFGFTKLEEKYPNESLVGFWAKSKIEPVPSYEDFITNSISAKSKVVWNFSFLCIDSTHTKVTTETRVQCVNPITKLFFSLYWLFVRPFSGLIRIKMLKIIKEDCE